MRKNKDPISTQNSKGGWINRFEVELKRLSPTLAQSLSPSIALAFFEDAKETPASAAAKYKAFKERQLYGQPSRDPKG